MIFPTSFCEYNANIVTQSKIIPWFPLSGIDSEIFENAKEIGLEKYISNLEDLCKRQTNYSKVSMPIVSRHAKDSLKTLKRITVTAGPKNIYDIIDSLKTDH